MKVIVAGSRSITRYSLVARAIVESGFRVTELFSGTAPGVDQLGEVWASSNGIPVRRFPAEWQKYGKRAGPIRNGKMAKEAEALVAIWDGVSRGTTDMIHQAQDAGLRIFIKIEKGDGDE